MIPAYLRIRTMGASVDAVKPELLHLLIQMVVYYLLAAVMYKISVKRQEKKMRGREGERVKLREWDTLSGPEIGLQKK
jgi:hypothetical protein